MITVFYICLGVIAFAIVLLIGVVIFELTDPGDDGDWGGFDGH